MCVSKENVQWYVSSVEEHILIGRITFERALEPFGKDACFSVALKIPIASEFSKGHLCELQRRNCHFSRLRPGHAQNN
jgi:hypothetical protein